MAVGALERFVADWALEHRDELTAPARPGHRPARGRRGLRAGRSDGCRRARQVRPQGHHLRGLPRPGRGAHLRHPRVPAAQGHRRSGRSTGCASWACSIEVNAIVGKTWTLRELRQDFDAVFIAVGAGLPVFMGIPGEDLKGVYSANEYLTRVNLMGAFRKDTDTPVLQGQRVVVVGGGNVAMDAVRTARRMGATEAVIAYRRGKEELPARREEVQHAEEEGVRFELMASPVEVRRQRRRLGDRAALPDDGAGRAGRVRAGGSRGPSRTRSTSSTAT